MNNDEYKSREELKSEYEDFRARQDDRDEAYKDKLENGQVSGFEKFCHGLTKFLAGCIDSLAKRI